jgi:hypothetical protein
MLLVRDSAHLPMRACGWGFESFLSSVPIDRNPQRQVFWSLCYAAASESFAIADISEHALHTGSFNAFVDFILAFRATCIRKDDIATKICWDNMFISQWDIVTTTIDAPAYRAKFSPSRFGHAIPQLKKKQHILARLKAYYKVHSAAPYAAKGYPERERRVSFR